MQIQQQIILGTTCLLLAATSFLPKCDAWQVAFYSGDKCGYSPQPYNVTTYSGPQQSKDEGNCLTAGDPRDGYDCHFYHDGGVRDDCTAPMHSGVGAAGLPESWFYPLGTICCVGFETLDQCEWNNCDHQPNLCIKGAWYDDKFDITEEFPFVSFYCYDGCPMGDCEKFLEANGQGPTGDPSVWAMTVGP